ncbi:MAG: NB-ARC domain-containing protein [Methylobacter sp.]|nr:NB-ARC domain-containing protein [Methylobacter sp.]
MRDIQQGDKSVYSENGNVTVNYAEKHIPKNLTRPPFISDVFIGRDDDIDAVHRQLFNDKPLLLLVNGEGGIGKTTLAAHYYSTYEDHYQHLAWVFAEDKLLDAVLTLAPPLQIVFPPDCPAPQRLDGLLAGMADLHKPCLLVIDNANNLAELENYYSALRACSNFHILMTTRITEFEQVACHKIKPLPWENARALFKQHYPGHHPDEDPLLQKILAAVGYNTLVIELLAKNLHNHNRLKIRYSLNDLFNDLQHKGLLKLNGQSVSSAYHSNGAALRKETPEAIIAAMYDLGELSDAEQALMSVFAVLPAENIAYPVLETLLTGFEKLDLTLLALAQKGWLDNIGSEFRVSPVVQEITRQKNQARLRQDCRNLIDSLIEQLEYEPGTGHFINADYQQAALFARHAESVVCHIVEPTENLAVLYERLGSYHRTTGNLDRALGFFEDETELFKALYEAYPDNVSFKNGLAISYEKQGDMHVALGHLDRALGFYEDETELFKALYEAYPDNVPFKNSLAISYEKLGDMHVALGHLGRALGFFEERSRLSKELYEAYPDNVSFKNGLAISCSKLGDTHAALGDLDRALGFYEDDLQLTKAPTTCRLKTVWRFPTKNWARRTPRWAIWTGRWDFLKMKTSCSKRCMRPTPTTCRLKTVWRFPTQNWAIRTPRWAIWTGRWDFMKIVPG